MRQGCLFSPVLFNLYIDEIIHLWLKELKSDKHFKELPFNTLLFADDQIILSNSENNLQIGIYKLNNIAKEYNLETSTS